MSPSPRPHPPVLLVILDGLGDRTWPELADRTPLEAAATPVLDVLAHRGSTGLMRSLGHGMAPGSELAHFVMFGYPRALFPGRVVFEAAGAGFDLPYGVVAYRALLSRVRRESDGTLTLVEHFADIAEETAASLAARIEPVEHAGLRVRFTYTGNRQGIVTIEGEASEHITDCDPFFPGRPIAAVEPLKDAADAEAARLTADAVTAFLRNTASSLAADAVFPLLKWIGSRRPIPSFEKRTGMIGAIVAHGALYRGLASELGMAFHDTPYAGDAGRDMAGRLERARQAFGGGADFVHVHTKLTDKAGHAKDPVAKRDVISAIDRGLEVLVTREGLSADTIIAVTGDHGTPAGTGLIHSGDPVPIVMSGQGVIQDAVTHFAEASCASGVLGHLVGEDLMPLLLNARGTTRYLGARLSSDVGLHWPDDYERFTLG